jgi:hypothetical protein
MSFDFYGPASSQAQEGLLVSFRANPTVQWNGGQSKCMLIGLSYFEK